MKYSKIGGQAVMEGIMMRNGDDYAVAVRKPDKEIEIKQDTYKGAFSDVPLRNVPFIRGVFAFLDSMVLGMTTLTWSASFYDLEDDAADGKTAESKEEEKAKDPKKEKAEMALMMVVSLAFAIGLFTMLPLFVASIFRRFTDSDLLIAVLEGVFRLAIFIGYLAAVSLMKDIRRVFMYHGAEHKCINCIEHGMELNVENVRKSSREHKRCGTSFLLYVIVISIIVFFFIRVDAPLMRVLIRLLLIPVIAGVSYEIIRLAGRSENVCVRAISRPGMWLQNLTTREPDDDMIEVGIAAVESVFDWRAFLAGNFGADKAE